MSEVTRCRNTDINAEAELPTDALVAYAAHGWEPITGASRTREVAEAERVDAENAAANPAASPAPAAPEAAAPLDSWADRAPADQPTPTAGDAGTTLEGEI